jgi:hypothetical protein
MLLTRLAWPRHTDTTSVNAAYVTDQLGNYYPNPGFLMYAQSADFLGDMERGVIHKTWLENSESPRFLPHAPGVTTSSVWSGIHYC